MTIEISQALVGWLVLVVDDEPDNLDVARRMLHKSGAQVITAENGKQALQLLQQHRPQFILCDISMPEMDGWTFIQELNRQRETAGLPVIALTAHSQAGDRVRAFEAGFVNYITKPLNITKFIHDLLNILVDVPELKRQIKTS
jgi:two-component system sensor histidine kinase ChiS